MKLNIQSDVAVSTNLDDDRAPRACAYPLTTVMSDGTVVTVYRGGTEKHTYDGVLLTQRSSDGGRTWSEPVVICDYTGQDPLQSVTSGGACQTGDGSLLVTFKTTIVTRPDDYVYSSEGLTQRPVLYWTQSHDAGQTWSPPRRIDVQGYSNYGVTSAPKLLPSGRTFIPLESKLPGTVSTTLGQFVSSVDDISGEFRDLGMSDPANELEHCDTRFAVVGDKMLALLWTFRKDGEKTIEVYRSVSDDEGETWSAPKPLAFIGQITVPLQLADGSVIAASNYRLDPPGIRLWRSEDVGATWQDPPIQMWDPRQSRMVAEPMAAPGTSGADEGVWMQLDEFTFGTPDLVMLNDGVILLTYYATLNDLNHVRACRFEVEADR